MNRIFIIFTASVLALSVFISGCGSTNNEQIGNTESSEAPQENIAPGVVSAYTPENVTAELPDDLYTKADLEEGYKESEAKDIIAVSGNDINITEAGIYTLSGKANDVTVNINVGDNDKVRLVLKDTEITNKNKPVIYIKNADKVFLFSEGRNKISVIEGFGGKEDGAIYAKDDIVFKGSGTLEITSCKHGVVGKDDVKITSGTYNINAQNHGFDVNDSFAVNGGNINITSGKDGVHAEKKNNGELGNIYISGGEIHLNCEGDGFDTSAGFYLKDGNIDIQTGKNGKNSQVSQKGIKADGNINIISGKADIDSADDALHCAGEIKLLEGEVNITSLDDGIHADKNIYCTACRVDIKKSYEGIEAETVNIYGGEISVVSTDDGINAAGGNDGSSIGNRPGKNNFAGNPNSAINIIDGNVYVNSGGDGLDSNGVIRICGGKVIIDGPITNGDCAFDYQTSGEISGGILIAIGSSGMATNATAATQGSVLYNFGNQAAGTEITLKNESGEVLLSHCAAKNFQSVQISAPSLILGGKYTITAGNTVKEFTLDKHICGDSGFGGNFGGGNRPGHGDHGTKPGQPGNMPGGMPGNMPDNPGDLPDMPGDMPGFDPGNIPDFDPNGFPGMSHDTSDDSSDHSVSH